VGPRAVLITKKFPAPTRNQTLEPQSSSLYPGTILTELHTALLNKATHFITVTDTLLLLPTLPSDWPLWV